MHIQHLPLPRLTCRALNTLLAFCLCWVQAQGKDVRTLRSLYYLAEVYCSPGAAGTPTLYDPALGALSLLGAAACAPFVGGPANNTAAC